MKRSLIIAVPSVLAVLVVALLVAPGFIDWNKYKDQAQDQIKITTGHSAEMRGNISLSVFPMPHVSIEDVQVAAPQGSADPVLARFKRLDVYLDVLPLLGGNVSFNSIALVEPVVALEVFKDGRQNWMTPELEAMQKKDPNAPKSSREISLQDISIEGGSFAYVDRSKAENVAPLNLANINIDAQAVTMQGPFDVNGSFAMAGRTFEIDARTGQMDGSGALKLNLDGKIKNAGGLHFTYAGIAATAAPYQFQGEVSLNVDSLKELAGNKDLPLDDDSLKLKGVLTATDQRVEFKDTVFAFAGNEFSGALGADLKPLKITGDLKASDTISIDKFIKPSDKKSSNLSGQILPETLSLPIPFEAGIRLSAPSMVWQKQMYKDVEILLSKQDKTFAADFTAGSIPGAGNLAAKGAMKFASKTLSQKDGTEVYSEPVLVVNVKGQSQNVAQSAEALTGTRTPALEMWKSGALNATATMTPDLLSLKDTNIKLGEDSFTIAGSYKASGARPKLVADIATNSIDYDAIQAKLGKSDQQGSLQDTLRGLALPFDLDFDFGAQSVRYQGKDIKGLRAQGSLRENVLNFTNLSAQDFAGAAFKAQGGISNLKELSGIDVTVSGQAGDAKELAKMAGMDVSTLPKSLQNAALAVAAKGTLDKLAVNANIKALNGDLIAKGDVDNPLGKFTISNMAIEAKHRNLAEAIQVFSPGSARYVSLEKPLDFYADIDRNGNVYSLKNMKANVAGSPVTGSFSVDMGAAKPTVKADLTFQDLTIQTAGAGAAKSGQRWSNEPIDTAWMNSYEADIGIKANSITYQSWNLVKPTLDVALHGGKLDIKQMNANLFGGEMKITSAMTAGNGSKGFSAVDTSATFKSVSLEQMVKALVGERIIKASGDVNLDTRITTSGLSQAALVSGLQGNGTTNGSKLVFEGFDLTKFAAALSDENRPGETLQGLWGSASNGGTTSFDTMSGAYTIENGIINITKLDMDGQQNSLATQGTINLPQWNLQTAHTITFKPQQTGEEPIPPFTIKIAGPLDNPGQTLGQGVLSDYLNRKLSRKLGNVLGDKLGDDNPLNNVLGGVLGIKPTPKKAATTPAAVTPAPAVPAPQAVEPAASELLAIEPAPVTETPPASAAEAAPVVEEPAKEPSDEEKVQDAMQGLLEGLTQQ